MFALTPPVLHSIPPSQHTADTKVIYLEDVTAFREYTLYVKDLTTGKILESIIDGLLAEQA